MYLTPSYGITVSCSTPNINMIKKLNVHVYNRSCKFSYTSALMTSLYIDTVYACNRRKSNTTNLVLTYFTF